MATPKVVSQGQTQRQKLEAERKEADSRIRASMERRSAKFKSLESGEEIELSIATIRDVIANPTKSGAVPTDRDCFLFMKLCEARRLNPMVGDAYLVGYDAWDAATKQTAPKFTMIVAHSALLKRAELSGHYDGLESGVLLKHKDTGEILEQFGDFVDYDRYDLVGGWAKVYRKDRGRPEYDRLDLTVYSTGRSRWKDDPAGMIVKVAEASALRRAFPGETQGMYVAEEFDKARNQVDEPGVRKIDIDPLKDEEDRLKNEDGVDCSEEFAQETPEHDGEIEAEQPETQDDWDPHFREWSAKIDSMELTRAVNRSLESILEEVPEEFQDAYRLAAEARIEAINKDSK